MEMCIRDRVWMAAIYLLLHLIADLLMGALDPRAKLELSLIHI